MTVHTKHLVTALLLLIALVLVGLTIYLTLFAQPEQMENPNSDSVLMDLTNPQIPSDWKTYTNEQYGFSLRYPSSFTVHERNENGMFSVAFEGAGDVAVSIVPNSKLEYGTTGGFIGEYDPSINAWIAADYFGEYTKNYYVLECPNTLIGVQKLHAHTIGDGDAGHSWSSTYIVTDKGYAIALGSGSDPESTAGESETQDMILASIQLQGVSALETHCDIARLGIQKDMPAVSEPQSGSSLSITSPLSVRLSRPLATGYGMKASIGANQEIITSGLQMTLKPITESVDPVFYSEYSGPSTLDVQFFAIVGGRRYLIGDPVKTPINLINNLPSTLNVRILDSVARDFYPMVDGKYVLPRGWFSEDIVHIEAANVKDCESVTNSMNDGLPGSFGSITDRTSSVFVDEKFPPNQVVRETWTCLTPRGEKLSGFVEFLSGEEIRTPN